jgi:hypothetical protein
VHLDLSNFCHFFVHLYRSRSRDSKLRLTEPEDLLTEEYDPNYSEELGDDLPGATPHAISQILLRML